MEWRFTSAVQNALGGSKIRKMNRPSVISARGHTVSLYPYRHILPTRFDSFAQKGDCEAGRIFLFLDAAEREKSANGGLTLLADF